LGYRFAVEMMVLWALVITAVLVDRLKNFGSEVIVLLGMSLLDPEGELKGKMV
jgi:hypothetical protein